MNDTVSRPRPRTPVLDFKGLGLWIPADSQKPKRVRAAALAGWALSEQAPVDCVARGRRMAALPCLCPEGWHRSLTESPNRAQSHFKVVLIFKKKKRKKEKKSSKTEKVQAWGRGTERALRNYPLKLGYPSRCFYFPPVLLSLQSSKISSKVIIHLITLIV